ncbi:MAG: hypothetical protein HBSAPP03_23480 [Phycisphaerae bacterium]|nr:MAG: hypothetical protein HBSAPP03_23480 [Phycisphaerae bacterium]
MAKPFDPRKILKQIANPLLREFFKRRGELTDVPWDTLTEHKIEPVFQGWQGLTDGKQREVQMIVRDVNELADHRGVAVLAEGILARHPQQAVEFTAQQSKADKAMWSYLHAQDVFDDAAMFARADALCGGRLWNRRNALPKLQLADPAALCAPLATALSAVYGPAQLRGKHCMVEHYRRADGADYFFAYLDDYPDKHLVFDGNDNQPVVRWDRYAFENVFVYSGDEGSLEIVAPGGSKMWAPLQVAFCKAVLKKDIPPVDPLKPSYRLDHLLRSDLPLPTDPADRVEDARITRLRIVQRGTGGHIEVKADPRAGRNDIYRKMDRWLRRENLPIEGLRVIQATFSIRFIHNGVGRQPTLTFEVSVPHSSNLKSKPDEVRVVGERCLRLWEVTDDQG